ncbi:MAG TPA: glycoside hydrolase family 3 C-terminal domain-containing protein, partial [Bryobacteraceae bacterium]|nr:glycoside hydrolase family 3 C-terminal domain-containing protein [Bryobacteraceae bacterium]
MRTTADKILRATTLVVLFLFVLSAAAQSSLEQRVNDLVSRMTLEEKVSQMQNRSVAIPRLGIPEYNWWNEGLHGIARSGYATVFPQAIGLAATWDTNLLREVATTISIEARAKYNQAVRDGIHSIYFGLTVWSPNINIFRDPRWGRGQETYGEDPFLTSRLGVAFVEGLQGADPNYLRVVATPKHFAVHSGPESERHRFDVRPSAFDLESTYLPAFHATITEGHADSLMCAYNAVNGVPACANQELLERYLRKDWHFGGYVTSDCGAVSDFYTSTGHKFSPDPEHAAAAAVKAGTDTSCGTEFAALTEAVKEKLVSEEVIDMAVKRLFTARFRLGMFDPASQVPYNKIPIAEDDSDAHRLFSLRVAQKSMVLLKNQNRALPLAEAVKTIAVVGPNAASLAALEGNYNAVPSRPILPVDGMEQEFNGRARVIYAQGAPYVDEVSLPVPRTALRPVNDASRTGLRAEYFGNSDFSGAPVLKRLDSQIDFDWNAASPAPGIPANDFSVRWTGEITPPESGEYRFDISFSHCYPCADRESYTVYIDNQQVAEHSTNEAREFRPSANAPFSIHFGDRAPHQIRIEYRHHSRLFGGGVTLNWLPPKGSLLPQAVAAARGADVVVAFVGLSPDLEGEEMPVHVPGFSGGDRTAIDLPEAQEELLKAVAATGKPLIVVLMNGSAVAVNWSEQHASAILEAWYPGESGGQAIAETVSGKNNPGGRLPITFYSSVNQLPPFDDYS